jgi:septal ring factor EnvC (AmiA/AmiB activator)
MKKWLCEFEIDKLVNTKSTRKETDADGKEIEISKTLKKNQPVTFKLQKPTRRLFEDGELYYAVKLSEGIKAGLLTTAQVSKRYENDGGVYTDAEKSRLRELRNDIAELQAEYFKLDRSDEKADKEKVRILSHINECRNEISELENVHQYIYDQTAEVKARNKTILWWILHMAHQQDERNRNQFMEMFGKSSDLEDRLDAYDRMEESGDDFVQESLKKLAYYVSYWYVSKNVSQEDFGTVESLYEQGSEYKVVEDKDEEEEAEKKQAEEKSKKKSEKKSEKKAKEKSKEKPEDKPEEKSEDKSEDKPKEKELAEEAK